MAAREEIEDCEASESSDEEASADLKRGHQAAEYIEKETEELLSTQEKVTWTMLRSVLVALYR